MGKSSTVSTKLPRKLPARNNAESKQNVSNDEHVFKYGKDVSPNKVKNVLLTKNNENNLKIASLNINRGLIDKEEKLINTINEHDFDICAVSEVDIKYLDDKKPFSLDGYNTYFPLQRPGSITTRILCFTKSNIDVTLREDLMSNMLSNIWLEIQGKGQKIIVCVMYREFNDLTGNGSMKESEEIERIQILHSQIEKARKEGLILIMGDMNIDLDKWEEKEYYQANQAKEYQTLIAENGLEIYHFGTTFKRVNTKGSAIDHALTNKPEGIKRLPEN